VESGCSSISTALTDRLGQRAPDVIATVNALICAGLFGVITPQLAVLAAEFLAT
jgi:hypothetical protein